MKTEFKDVVHLYTRSKLKLKATEDYKPFYSKGSEVVMSAMLASFIISDEYKNFKPIMNSFDKLTEPITVDGYNDGKEFVPIQELRMNCNTVVEHDFVDNIADFIEKPYEVNYDLAPFSILNQLIKWHFNVFGVNCIDK